MQAEKRIIYEVKNIVYLQNLFADEYNFCDESNDGN